MVRIFDEDEDGQIHAADLVEVLTSFGDKLTKSEARKLVQKAHKSKEGLIDYQGKKNLLSSYLFIYCQTPWIQA